MELRTIRYFLAMAEQELGMEYFYIVASVGK